MTLVSTIIRDAYRESNLIAISADPTTAEQEEGLRLLNRVISGVYGSEAGEQLDPLPLGQNNIHRPSGYPYYGQSPDFQDWFIPANARLVLNLTEALTVYLDPNPDDGARFAIQDMSSNLATRPLTVVANGRLINGATTLVANTNGYNKEFFYRQDTGTWAILSPLEDTDVFPFPEDFDDMFVIILSMRLNPRHDVPANDQSVNTMRTLMKQFKARYRQHTFTPSEPALLRLPGNRRRFYDDTRYGNAAFVTGWPNFWR